MPQFTVTLMTECPVRWRMQVEATDAEAARKLALEMPWDRGHAENGRVLVNDWQDLDAREYEEESDGGLQVERVECPETGVDLSAAAGIMGEPRTCAGIVHALAAMTDPRQTSEPEEELAAFARLIGWAKEIMGDYSPEQDEPAATG